MTRRFETLRPASGPPLWVRPIEAEDAAELQRAFALLTDLSRYRRFLTGTPALTDRRARFFTEVDHVDHVALVALPTPRATEILGVARFVRYRDAPDEADLAITVADAWQGRRIGTGLLRLLIARARAVGVRRFTVDLAEDNLAVRALVRSAGGEVRPAGERLLTGHIDLEPSVATP